MAIVLSTGEQLRISKKPLGVGGEGKVFRIANTNKSGLVAKIYNKLPDAERQQKIRAMVSLCQPQLLDACAWPLDSLIDSNSGSICGFIMKEVEDSEPLHHYYSPAWRRLNQPLSTWETLIKLASNLAAAFNIVHANGVIVGDVNPNSVRVRGNGRVMLIDADSFQLSHKGTAYRCRVGVPSFTAPELLAVNQAFDSITREVNHDLFGLSLLLFHLLFMGRHPFAGIYSGTGENPIETHIREFRYAYAADYSTRGLAPPPLSVSPGKVASRAIVRHFENDFTQLGAIKGRTSADAWHRSLVSQYKNLKRCINNAIHVYDSNLNSCIWCELEKRSLVFFQSTTNTASKTKHTNQSNGLYPAALEPSVSDAEFWREISTASPNAQSQGIQLPSLNQPSSIQLTSEDKVAIVRRSFVRLVCFLTACGAALSFQPAGYMIAGALACIGFLYCPEDLATKIMKKRSELRDHQNNIAIVNQELQALIKTDKSPALRTHAQDAWQELSNLKSRFDKDILSSLTSARQQSQEAFLRKYLIVDASISGIGSSRTSTLASYGIETAADITKSRLYSIGGFGPVLVASLLSWRQTLLSRWTAPSDSELINNELRSTLAKYISTKQKCSIDLHAACHKLRQINNDLILKQKDLEARLSGARQSCLVCQADLGQLSQSASKIYSGKYPYLIW